MDEQEFLRDLLRRLDDLSDTLADIQKGRTMSMIANLSPPSQLKNMKKEILKRLVTGEDNA